MSERVSVRKPLLFLAAVACTTACDDPFEFDDLNTVSDTVILYSLSRPELQGLPSAYDFPFRTAVVLESAAQAGDWDFALVDDGGALSLAPEPALTGSSGRAAISVDSTRTFEDVGVAPSDTAQYTRFATVPAVEGRVYIVRTRSEQGCVFFAKVQPLDIDPVAGRMEFRFLHNPNCGDRDLVPSED